MPISHSSRPETIAGVVLRALPLVGLGVGLPTDAFAYIDGGSASLLFQAAAASLFTGLFLLKTYWAGIRAWVVRLRSRAPRSGP